jgi:hypothetical protein
MASLGLLAAGLVAIYILNTRYFRNEQLNAAGINTQVLTTMIARGDKLLNTTTQLQAEAQVISQQPTSVAAPAKATSSEHPLWQPASRTAPTPSIPLSDKVIAYEAIQIDAHSTSFPVIGQQFNLPLLKGRQVQAKVEGARLHDNGDYSWRGHLIGVDGDYPVVMTYGESGIFASITTPEGSYSLESINGLGWLYKNPAEPELSSPGSEDSLLPPQE